MENKKYQPFYIPSLTALAVFLVLGLFSLSSVYQGMRYAMVDFKWRLLAQPTQADTTFTVIAIDDASIGYFADRYNFSWPWPRQFYAIVLDYLKAAGAGTVVFDLHFTEPDLPRMEISAEFSDGELGRAVAEYRHVVMTAMLTDSLLGRGSLPTPQKLLFENREQLVLPRYPAIRFPVPAISAGLQRIGTTHFITDADGICRRLPLVVRVQDDLYPQLGFAAYLEATGDSILAYDPGKNRLRTRRLAIELDDDGNFPIYWYGPGGESGVYRYDSFHAVFLSALQFQSGLEPIIPLSSFRGKKIIVCATAGGLLDLKPTPFTAVHPYPGGEIHLTMWNNLTSGHFLRLASDRWIQFTTLLFSAFLSFIIINRRLLTAVLLAIAGILSFVFLALIGFRFFRTEIDLLFPSLGVLLTTGTAAVYRTLTEGRSKRQLRTLFSRYLSPEVITLLMENPERVDLEGAETTGTVMFTDLQGFTTFSEQKSPKEVIKVLNTYFETISSIVLDQEGLLDKYTGDGIMAIFGAPLPRKDHARAACEVILAFRECKVNELIPTAEENVLTRIGISSGPMVIGNLGSARRMDFTAIGDTVNLAARLEGVNKSYGTTNILSESTWNYVKNEYLFRELDYIRVKGKHLPIRVFTLIDRRENSSPRRLEIEALFAEAMKLYRLRKWEKAIAAFQQVLAIDPEDHPAAAFVERCQILVKTPDLVDSQGVFTFKTK